MKKLLLSGIAALLLATGTARAEQHITIVKLVTTNPPDLKSFLGPLTYSLKQLVALHSPPNRPAMHLGPAVWSKRPWHAERMPIKVKLPPIGDWRIVPPDEFDHEYAGDILVNRTDEEGIKSVCKGTNTQTGCSYFVAGTNCFVWIVYDDILNRQRLSYDMVLRHERAHCNGWRR